MYFQYFQSLAIQDIVNFPGGNNSFIFLSNIYIIITNTASCLRTGVIIKRCHDHFRNILRFDNCENRSTTSSMFTFEFVPILIENVP